MSRMPSQRVLAWGSPARAIPVDQLTRLLQRAGNAVGQQALDRGLGGWWGIDL